MDKVDVRFPQPAKPAANLPKNAQERAVALVELMGRLTALLEREAAAVRARRPAKELAQIVKDKQPMTLVYEEVSRLLRVDREGLIGLAPELKTALKDATARLYAATMPRPCASAARRRRSWSTPSSPSSPASRRRRPPPMPPTWAGAAAIPRRPAGRAPRRR